MKRFLFIVLTLLLLAAFQAYAGERPKLKVGYAPGGGSILTLVAQDKKFFEKEGLDVELVQFASSSDGLNALNTGKIDFGVSFGTAGPLAFISKGADFTIIGGMLAGGHPIIALPENKDKFKSIQDFKGKTIATARIYTADVVWRGALKRAGIDPNKDVTIIELKNPSAVLEAVKAGKVDAGIGSSTIVMKLEQAGVAVVGWSNDLFPDHPCCRVVARGKNTVKYHETYRAFLRALIQAEKFKHEHPDSVVSVAMKYLNLDEPTARAFVLEPHQSTRVDPDTDGVKQMWDDMKSIDYVQNADNIDITKYINTTLYQEALGDLLKKYPRDRYYLDAKKRFAKRNSEDHAHH
ncbi:ABC transporter substrate-binding protein [Seleniivibrio sp.]|uniref:ABC transporter substrate-binding protein n=1 Tax=Seleniivibrio sp. TaxID=2898801 RepID=UPI0025FBD83A|nr:ABC transporter substrate-binding protein [Seleniivibrio sp.]MCD8553095.1 ABC transporter substrate-binding protein [Seleniivibrio sp.]